MLFVLPLHPQLFQCIAFFAFVTRVSECILASLKSPYCAILSGLQLFTMVVECLYVARAEYCPNVKMSNFWERIGMDEVTNLLQSLTGIFAQLSEPAEPQELFFSHPSAADTCTRIILSTYLQFIVTFGGKDVVDEKYPVVYCFAVLLAVFPGTTDFEALLLNGINSQWLGPMHCNRDWQMRMENMALVELTYLQSFLHVTNLHSRIELVLAGIVYGQAMPEWIMWICLRAVIVTALTLVVTQKTWVRQRYVYKLIGLLANMGFIYIITILLVVIHFQTWECFQPITIYAVALWLRYAFVSMVFWYVEWPYALFWVQHVIILLFFFYLKHSGYLPFDPVPVMLAILFARKFSCVNWWDHK